MSVKANFIPDYILTIIIFGNFLIMSIPMTNIFTQNLFIHFFMTIMLTLVTLFIEFLSNQKLTPKEKAIKIGPLVLINALITFFACVIFVYV